MRDFNSLSEKEILALAIFLEEEDERIYADLAEGLRENFPGSAEVFDGMREEESGHRRRLIELFRRKFGEHIPLIRRQDVKGFVERKPVWNLVADMTPEQFVSCIDFRYLTDALTRDEALEVLRGKFAARGEREARMRKAAKG